LIKWDRGRNCCLYPAWYYCCSVNFVNRKDRYYIIPRIDVLGSLQSKLAARIISIYLKQKRNRIIGNSWNAAALSTFLVIRWRWAAISRKAYYYSCYYMRCSGFFSYYWSLDCLFLFLPNFAEGGNMSTAAEYNQWLRSFKEIFFLFFVFFSRKEKL
jgi:hypothetical protein